MCTSWGETVLLKVIVPYKNGENSGQEGRFERGLREISEKMIPGERDINDSAATAAVYSWPLFCALKRDTAKRAG